MCIRDRVSTLDDLHTQLSLELTDAGRQRGLRDVACLGRATEVALARQSAEVLQLAHQYGTWIPRRKRDVKPAPPPSGRGPCSEPSTEPTCPVRPALGLRR